MDTEQALEHSRGAKITKIYGRMLALVDELGLIARKAEPRRTKKVNGQSGTGEQYGSSQRRIHQRMCQACIFGEHKLCTGMACPCLCND